MKRHTLITIVLFVCVFCVCAGVMTLNAESENGGDAAAELLPASVSTADGDASLLSDGDEVTYSKISKGGTVTVSSESGISSLYVLFDRICGEWTLSDGSTGVVRGKDDFLHEYIDVEGEFGYAPRELTMRFSSGCQLSEIYAFGAGKTPDWVQIWQPPCESADLLLTSTHIDDEQLFFAGILPYYAGELGLDVQVVYFTTPFTYHERQHEQLNGLWTVGVRNYPVSGEFKDAFSETAKDAYADQKGYGFSRDDMVLFQARMIRRFRPHVIVGHDINGEYSHGQHIINCETLMDALDLAADASFDAESAAEYGVWDTPKTYIHLWDENKIVMDWDVPLEKFDGKTAFQVSQDGFQCHKSQQWTWFHGWMYGKNTKITKATEIKTYSPCLYGLYRTTVGVDVTGGDMFEHIPLTYAEIRAQAEAEAESSRAESERVSAAESERAESERLDAESRKAASDEQSTTDAQSTNGNGDGGGGNNNGNVFGAVVVAAACVAAAALAVPIIANRKNKR